jgi:Asp-tRNA(Asn)/Glu-tRNA(Gln) amidotransferase A subunit family amidase
MSAEPQRPSGHQALDQLLAVTQQLETKVNETAKRVKLAWARSQKAPLSREQERQFKAAAAELARVSAAIEHVHFEVPVPPVSDEERDRLIAELQALFSHIPPGVSLADGLSAGGASARESARMTAAVSSTGCLGRRRCSDEPGEVER